MSAASPERRVAAVVLPALLVELGRPALGALARAAGPTPRGAPARSRGEPSFAVVLADDAPGGEAGGSEVERVKPAARLDAVGERARRFGVCEGQSIAEARALVASLEVRVVTRAELLRALERVAEVALGFGATVAVEAPDTVWVDVTGSAHLAGGEARLGLELASQVRALGHRARVAVSGGPRLAQAFARSFAGGEAARVVPPERTAEALAPLPVVALPIDTERASWLLRVGIATVGELRALPRASAASRLGPGASRLLDLCEGKDAEPLTAFTPPSVLVEEASFDEPLGGVEPLGFVLSGLAARLSARLGGRGLAARALELVIEGDRSIARLRGAPERVKLRFELEPPLWREEELRRVIASRLERTRLAAPSRGLRLEVPLLTPARARQLELSRVSGGALTGSRGLEALPVLLAELTAELGRERVGTLRVLGSHRLEASSVLAPVLDGPAPVKPRKARGRAAPPLPGRAPLRVLQEPVPLDAPLRKGALLSVERRLYSIDALGFERRVDEIEWWLRPVARDYLRLWLSSPEGCLEALVYVDRHTGKRFLHALAG